MAAKVLTNIQFWAFELTELNTYIYLQYTYVGINGKRKHAYYSIYLRAVFVLRPFWKGYFQPHSKQSQSFEFAMHTQTHAHFISFHTVCTTIDFKFIYFTSAFFAFIRWRNIYKHLTALSCTYLKIHSNKFVLVNNPPSPNSSFLCHKYRKNGYVTSFLLEKKMARKRKHARKKGIKLS